MPNPYSLDLRARIVKDYDVGVPVEDLVAHYAVSRSWIYSLLQLRRDTGSITPHPYRRGRKQKLAPHEQTVRQLVGEYPDATLSDFCEMLSDHVSVSPAALCNFLRHLKIVGVVFPSIELPIEEVYCLCAVNGVMFLDKYLCTGQCTIKGRLNPAPAITPIQKMFYNVCNSQ